MASNPAPALMQMAREHVRDFYDNAFDRTKPSELPVLETIDVQLALSAMLTLNEKVVGFLRSGDLMSNTRRHHAQHLADRIESLEFLEDQTNED